MAGLFLGSLNVKEKKPPTANFSLQNMHLFNHIMCFNGYHKLQQF